LISHWVSLKLLYLMNQSTNISVAEKQKLIFWWTLFVLLPRINSSFFLESTRIKESFRYSLEKRREEEKTNLQSLHNFTLCINFVKYTIFCLLLLKKNEKRKNRINNSLKMFIKEIPFLDILAIHLLVYLILFLGYVYYLIFISYNQLIIFVKWFCWKLKECCPKEWKM